MLYLAIDGGGSKTDLLLCGEDGEMLGTVTVGGSNPNDGAERAKENLAAGIREVLGDRDPSETVLCAGVSGAAGGRNNEMLKAFFASFGFAEVTVFGDAAGLIEGGLHGRGGIVYVMGTGSVCYAVQSGQTRRFGGWGHLFDFGGDGYSMGRAALYASLCDEDGSGEKTSLRAACEKRLGRTVGEAVPDLIAGGKKEIASFAPVLLEEAKKGDPLASRLLEKEIGAIVGCLKKALAFFGENGVPVVLCGGLSALPEMTGPIALALAPKGKTEVLPIRPVEGVMALARKGKKEKTNA